MGWLSDFFFGGLHQVAMSQSERELKEYVSRLRSIDDLGIAMILASATNLRLKFQQTGDLPKVAFEMQDLNPNNLPESVNSRIAIFQVELSRMIARQQYQGNPEAACGLIWLHTLRTINYETLQPLGAEMWRELRRGFKYSEDSRFKSLLPTEPENFAEELRYIPAIYR